MREVKDTIKKLKSNNADGLSLVDRTCHKLHDTDDLKIVNILAGIMA